MVSEASWLIRERKGQLKGGCREEEVLREGGHVAGKEVSNDELGLKILAAKEAVGEEEDIVALIVHHMEEKAGEV